jgi:hypothetical protein
MGKKKATGAVHVMYGNYDVTSGNRHTTDSDGYVRYGGLTFSDDQVWNQDVPGTLGTSMTGDFYGGSLLAVDFNNNRIYDLVVGIPRKDLGSGLHTSGEIIILHGNRGSSSDAHDTGLNTDHNHLLHLETR